MAKSDVTNYFRRSSVFWMSVVTVSMGFFTCTVYAPEVIPYDKLGPFGTFTKYLVDNHADILYKGWWAAFAIHVFEAVYSQKVCSDKGIHGLTARLLWFGQTFLFGFASLGILLKFDPKRPKHH
ncbi:transmembrane protein 254 [Boleophthalmus pectinirostris]|uniref:transmembrane protein 254 n=1 Tax=Boleophthalmus pectinirostris TaxID=150288 RepID=UPI000A1C761E|nr:transmembrane protein 254 [Boleophthalmus pectinirostris]